MRILEGADVERDLRALHDQPVQLVVNRIDLARSASRVGFASAMKIPAAGERLVIVPEPRKSKENIFGAERPMRLDSGVELGPFTIAYQTYGALNRERSNAILVCHALCGDQFAAELHPITGKPGWWEFAVGPGVPFDTAATS